jgi:hypothetical protein
MGCLNSEYGRIKHVKNPGTIFLPTLCLMSREVNIHERRTLKIAGQLFEILNILN